MKTATTVGLAIAAATLVTSAYFLPLLEKSPQAEASAQPSECEAMADESIVSQCLTCHRGSLSLRGEDTDEIAEAIAKLADGELSHPVPVPKLSREAVHELAVALTCE